MFRGGVDEDSKITSYCLPEIGAIRKVTDFPIVSNTWKNKNRSFIPHLPKYRGEKGGTSHTT